MTAENYITMADVLRIMRCCRATIYNLISAGRFPQGSKIGKQRVWRESDVRRIAEAWQPSEKEMREIIANAS